VTSKHIAWIALAVAVALGVGWVWGASGRSDREQARRAEEQRADLAEARAMILDGRVLLYQANFGTASRRFESAAALVEEVQRRLRESAQAERAGRLEIVLAHLRDAQSLAAAFDPGAHAAAEEAFTAIK
jgi:hypothetical protein